MKFTFYLLLCLFSFSLSAQHDDMSMVSAGGTTTGMQFVDKPFADLLAQAKAEDKVIFIDAYTTWCGPCKMMAAKVFPAEEVGNVYNERFINAKFDMEKGEGLELAQRYSVVAYPTYLFVNGDGELVHKGLGYIPQEAFLELADLAAGPENLLALGKRYAAGERDEDFVMGYIETLNSVYEEEKAAEVIGTFLESQDDLSSPEIMDMIIANPGKPGSKSMNYLMENADVAIEKIGSGDFIMNIQRAIISDYIQESGVRALPPVEKMEASYTKYAGSLKPRLLAHYTMLHANQSGDMDTYLPAAVKYYGTYPSNDAIELNSVAWNFYENAEKADQLKVALGWAKQSVDIEAGYANMDTLAWIYSKMGNKKMAKATAVKAIELAKVSGEDYSSTEELLQD